MIVTLSSFQERAVYQRVPELHQQKMLEHRTANRRKHDFELPAIAWRQILDAMRQQCFGPMGGKQDKVPQAAYSAIKQIATGVMMIENHPALRNRSIEGWFGSIILAWDCDPVSPYPSDGCVPVWFNAEHLVVQGRHITQWKKTYEAPQFMSWSLNPVNHMLFVV